MTTEIIVEKVEDTSTFGCRNCGIGDMTRLDAMLHQCDVEGVRNVATLAERDRVVAWLRSGEDMWRGNAKDINRRHGDRIRHSVGVDVIKTLADAIERGDHITTGQEEGA